MFRHYPAAAPATSNRCWQGVVVFFASFRFLEEVRTRWVATGQLRQLAGKKRTFFEPRAAGQVRCLSQASRSY